MCTAQYKISVNKRCHQSTTSHFCADNYSAPKNNNDDDAATLRRMPESQLLSNGPRCLQIFQSSFAMDVPENAPDRNNPLLVYRRKKSFICQLLLYFITNEYYRSLPIRLPWNAERGCREGLLMRWMSQSADLCLWRGQGSRSCHSTDSRTPEKCQTQGTPFTPTIKLNIY